MFHLGSASLLLSAALSIFGVSTASASEANQNYPLEHIQVLQELLSDSDQRFDVHLVSVLENCQLLWVSRNTKECRMRNQQLQRIVSVDLRNLKFGNRSDEWTVSEFIYDSNLRGIGTARTLPFRTTPNEAIQRIQEITEYLDTRNFKHNAYCEDPDTVRVGAAGQFVYVEGETALLFEEEVTKAAKACLAPR